MFNTLSEQQKKIVFEKSGKFVVRACPGSGKTYSVAARLAYRINNWGYQRKGIAALSFTNAAWQEIAHQVEAHFNTSIATKYPHFLGTIDSFINKYIFLPFGHLVMGCKQRPVLVGEPYSSWDYCPYENCYEQYFGTVSYDIDDSLIYPQFPGTFFFRYSQIFKKDSTESQHATNLRKMKQEFWGKGYANQRDANYFAVKILEKYPPIAKALIARFSEFIIDEAQDTSEVQIRLIDVLIENGLNEVMLIGDPDQAIFEWNNARPEFFSQKYEVWERNSVELCENRRSSQKICDFTVKLTSMTRPSTAIDAEIKDYHLSPEIVSYDYNATKSVQNTIKMFIKKCRQNDIGTNPKKIAILFRSNNFIDTILGSPSTSSFIDPWIRGDAITKDMVKAKFFIDNNEYKEGYKLLEKVFIKAVLNKKQCLNEDIQASIDEIGFVQHRKEIYGLACILPSTIGVNIDTWVCDANRILDGTGLKLNIGDNGSIPMSHLFQREICNLAPNEYRLGTVHSVKGETFEAILLLLKQKGASGKFYRTLLNNEVKTDSDEELRIVYVAITRPRKFLMIAVPNQCVSYWEDFFKN